MKISRRHRPLIAWCALALLGSIVACTLPLLGTLGYEFSLFSSLFLSLAGGQLAACYPHYVRHQQAPFPGARRPVAMLYFRALGSNFILAALPLLVALVNRSITPPCNELIGIAFYVLMPLCSLLLATAVGLLIGILLPGRRLASLAWLVVFFVGIGYAFYIFYSGPAVYLYGPFFGYFPGVLYDELVTVNTKLLTYRIGTILEVVLVLSFLSWVLDIATLRIAGWKKLRNRKRFLTFLLLAMLTVGFDFLGPSLGHRTDREQLEKALSRVIKKDRLDVYFCPRIDEKVAGDLAADAAFSLHQVESFLGIRAEKRIAIFVFSSIEQKGELMGASGTNVAKPWRSEIYITAQRPPHMVLRHELVHAVSAAIGRGIFAISGKFFGLWPSPGLIEGLAVAAGGQRGELSVHSWAAAMSELGILPHLESLFGLGFFNFSASSAYVAAGSFCDFMRGNYGVEVLRKAYTRGDFEGVTEKDLAELEKEWLAFLANVTLRPKDLAAAKQRFDRPAVVHSVCVHEVARLRSEAVGLAGQGMWDEALSMYREALDVSGKATATRLQLFFALADAGRVSAVEKMADKLLVDKTIHRATRMSIEEILADLNAEEGKLEKAAAVYAKLAGEVAGESAIRRLQAKTHFARMNRESIKYLLQVLYLRPGPKAVSDPLAILRIAEAYADHGEDAALTYLMARQHFRYGNFESAAILFDQALSRGLAGISLEMLYAAKISKGQSLFEQKKYRGAREVFEELKRDTTFGDGLRKQAEDWAERCDYYLRPKSI